MDRISRILFKQLLSLDFPYKETLNMQLEASRYDVKAYCDVICIEFHLDNEIPRLPSMLDVVPLSWQLFPPGGCLGCDLFLKDGHIDALQLVDYAGGGIKWEELNECIPEADYDYDISHIYQYLSGEVELQKIRQSSMGIDIALSNKNVVLSLRDCAIHHFAVGKLPVKHTFSILLNGNGGSLRSTDGNVEIDFQLVFLRYHTQI